MSNDLIEVGQGFDRIYSLAEKLSKSGIIPNGLRNKPNDITAILLMGKEMNLPPMMSLQMINVIDGRPELSSQGKLAVIKRNFPDAFIQTGFNGADAFCTMGRNANAEKTTCVFGPHDAQKAELMGRATYKKFPKNMFMWRAVGNCARIVFPDIMLGLYSADEIEDIRDSDHPIKEDTKTVKDIKFNLEMPKDPATEYVQATIENLKDPAPKTYSVFSFGQFKNKAINEVPVKDVKSYIEFLQRKDFKFDTWKGDFFHQVAEYIGDDSFLKPKELIIQCNFCPESYVSTLSECPNCGRNEADGLITTDEIPF